MSLSTSQRRPFNFLRRWWRDRSPDWLYRRLHRRWYCVYCKQTHDRLKGCPSGLPLHAYGPRFMVYGKKAIR